MSEPGVWLIAFLFIAGIGFIVAVVVIQSRGEQREIARTATEEWSQIHDPQITRSEFTLFRIILTPEWTRAAYVLQNEDHVQVGTYVSQSRVRADVELHGKKYQMYIQRSGAFATEWSGKVGASSPSGIVVRTKDQVVAELQPVGKFPGWTYELKIAGQTYRIDNGGWVGTKPRSIHRNSGLCGVILRPGLTSRTVLLALRPELSDAALLAILVASLLQ